MRLSTFSRATPLFFLAALISVFALVACSDDSESEAPAGATPVPTLVTIDTPEPGDSSDSDAGGDDGGVANGKTVFEANACAGCHSTGDNTLLGPGLAGIGERAASQVADQDADAYLREAIVNPGAYVVDGFQNVMPPNFGDLPDDEINDLIAYLKSL